MLAKTNDGGPNAGSVVTPEPGPVKSVTSWGLWLYPIT